MISNERLEELIRQCATIYELDYRHRRIEEIQLKSDWFIMGDYLHERKLSKHPFKSWIISDLYETKEDAEFVKEFGYIERTERLKLPTWGKVNEIIEEQKWFELNFKTEHEEIAFIVNDCQIAVMMKGENYLSGSDDELNKENYIKACREVKKLFLGEEIEE